MVENDWIQTNIATKKPDEDFRLAMKLHPFSRVSFDEACDKAARDIYELYGEPYLALSGGKDSIMCAKVFLRNGIPFKPVTVVVSDAPLFHYDQMYAVEFCKQNNLKQEIIEVTSVEAMRLYVKNIYPLGGKEFIAGWTWLLGKRDAKVINGGEAIGPHGMETELLESVFYPEICDAFGHIPFFIYNIEIVGATVEEALRTGLYGEDLKCHLYRTTRKKSLGGFEGKIADLAHLAAWNSKNKPERIRGACIGDYDRLNKALEHYRQ